MKQKERFQIKDKILQTLSNQQLHVNTISELSEHLNIKYSVIHTLCIELKDEKYIDGKSLSSKTPEAINDFCLILIPKGDFMINEDGGFQAIYNKKRLENAWLIIKIIAATLNSIAILYLSWKAVFRN